MKAKCPDCEHTLDLPESISGVSIKCGKCGRMLMIPGNMGMIAQGVDTTAPEFAPEDKTMDALDKLIAEKRRLGSMNAGREPDEEEDAWGDEVDFGKKRMGARKPRGKSASPLETIVKLITHLFKKR